MHSEQPSVAHNPFEVADNVDPAALADAMRTVPLGLPCLPELRSHF